MNKTIIGCDPDSDKSGFCIVKNGELLQLCVMDLIQFYNYCYQNDSASNPIELHIENVNGISAAFNARDRKSSLAVKLKVAQHIGMCKQVQIEIERIANHFGIKVVHHPVSKMWKDSKAGKAALKEIFGYDGQSNEDSRSACYFAYRALQMNK